MTHLFEKKKKDNVNIYGICYQNYDIAFALLVICSHFIPSYVWAAFTLWK